MKTATTFCPAGVSSFFQSVTPSSPLRTKEGTCRIGAWGGGFILERGVKTQLCVQAAEHSTITVSINGTTAPNAKVTRAVCSQILELVDSSYEITINYQIEVPLGAGYGISAAGAVSTALALSRVLDLNLTLNQISQFAHTAEIRCATGLGSVSGVVRGGIFLILEPGAPGFDRVDWLPQDPSLRIITGSFAPIPKGGILFSKAHLTLINQEAQVVLTKIFDTPSISYFLELCYTFAQKSGFLSNRVRKIIGRAIKAGAIGATQNMIGDAFHVLADVQDVEKIIETIKEGEHPKDIFVSGITKIGPKFL